MPSERGASAKSAHCAIELFPLFLCTLHSVANYLNALTHVFHLSATRGKGIMIMKEWIRKLSAAVRVILHLLMNSNARKSSIAMCTFTNAPRSQSINSILSSHYISDFPIQMNLHNHAAPLVM